jgi:hypothetical protein
VFYLGYHLHWPPQDTLALATPDRWAYVRLLGEQLERERDAIEAEGRH